MIRESSRLTGIHFCSFKCSVNVRLYLQRCLWILKAFEEIKHHFTCKIPHCKIDSRKNIGTFHASRTNIEILSRSRKNQGDHVSRRHKINSQIDIFTSFNLFRLSVTDIPKFAVKGFTGKMMFYLFKSLQKPQTALKTKTYVHSAEIYSR